MTKQQLADYLLPTPEDWNMDTADLISAAVDREISYEELARYSQLSPELAPMLEAIICNQEELTLNQNNEQCIGELRC